MAILLEKELTIAFELGQLAYRANLEMRPIDDPEFCKLLPGRSGHEVATRATDWVSGWEQAWERDWRARSV